MRYIMISLMAFVMLAPAMAWGQDQGRHHERSACWMAQGGPPDAGMRRQARGPGPHGSPNPRHLEQLRLLKMLEVLDLSEDQELAFVTIFHQAREEMRRLQEENREAIRQLADGLAADTLDDATINDLIEQVYELRRQQFQQLSELIEESERILTPRQRGKLVVFHERFEAEMLKKLRAFRDQRFERGIPDTDSEPARDNVEQQ